MFRTIYPDGTKSDFIRKDLSQGQPLPTGTVNQLMNKIAQLEYRLKAYEKRGKQLRSQLDQISECTNIKQVKSILKEEL